MLAERIPLEGTGAVDVERQRAVVAALRTFLPDHCILWREEDTRPYECDGLTLYRQVPMVVALPETEEQVSRIARTCFELDVPIVPRGAGTGLSGGALPLACEGSDCVIFRSMITFGELSGLGSMP